MVFNASAIMQV